jgi:hypothetical protein
MFEPHANGNGERYSQRRNWNPEAVSEGIQIEPPDGHSEKTKSIMPQGFSNVKVERLSQPAKHAFEIRLMDEQTKNDVSDEQFENAPISRIEILDWGSNVNVDRFVHLAKHAQGIT